MTYEIKSNGRKITVKLSLHHPGFLQDYPQEEDYIAYLQKKIAESGYSVEEIADKCWIDKFYILNFLEGTLWGNLIPVNHLKEFLKPVLDYSDEKDFIDKRVKERERLAWEYSLAAGFAIRRINKALGNEMT